MKLYATRKTNPIFALAALVTLAGCAFVESRTDNKAPGVSYYLPMRPVKLTYTRTVQQSKQHKALFDAQYADQAAQLEMTSAFDEVAKLTLLLANTPAGAGKLIVQAKLEAATARQTAASVALVTATTALTKATAAFDGALPGVPPVCVINESLTAEPLALTADHSQRYIAALNHSVFRTDALTLTTTAAGLLDNLVGTAQEQTPAILVALAQSQVALGIGLSGSGKAFSSDGNRGMGLQVNCAVKPLKVEEILNPYDPEALNQFAAQTEGHSLCLEPLFKTDGIDTSNLSIANSSFNGLAYRRDKPYVLKMFDSTNALKASIRLDLPQGAPIEMLELKAGFANTVTLGADFDNGMLITHTNNRPSEALAVAGIPFSVISAALAVPTSLFSLKVTNIKKEAEYVNALNAQICADEKLAAARENRAVVSTRCVPLTP